MAIRGLTSSLILIVALLALATLPPGLGDALTTVIESVTTGVIIVEGSNSTLSTTRSLSTQVQTYTQSTAFAIDATGGAYGCVYKALRFTAKEGDVISGKVTSDIPISFFIMTSDDYGAWRDRNSCTASSSLFQQQKTTSFGLNMVVPSAGDYDLVFLNLSSNMAANIGLSFNSASNTVMTISVPVVSVFLVTRTTMSTLTTAQTHTLESHFPSTEVLNAALVLLCAIVVVLALMRVRGRGKPDAVKYDQPISGNRFCGNCGTPLSPEAKSCNRCGKQQ